MTIVRPASFTKVFFDGVELARVFDAARSTIPGLPPELEVIIDVDEDAPTTRMAISSLTPVVFDIESGALEDSRSPRAFGEEAASATFARLLLELRDRWDVGFAAPPLDAELSQADRIAWAVHCYGRAGRLGFRVFKPRYRYDYRNRHGFSDASDANFEALWSADDLTWKQIEAITATGG